MGGCLGNLPVMVFIGRLMTIKVTSGERGILFYAHTLNQQLMRHKRI